MEDRRNEVQNNRNYQNWPARDRRYNRRGWHLDDVWRENYDDAEDDDDNKNNIKRSYSNNTFYNRNSHNVPPCDNYVRQYGHHQLRPEPYRISSNRSRGHSNAYRPHFPRYGSPTQNTSSRTAQTHNSSNSNAPARDACNNILDDNLLERLNSLHDTTDGHVTKETDLPNLEEPMLNFSEDDTRDAPAWTTRSNNNLITINQNRSYLRDLDKCSSRKLENSTVSSNENASDENPKANGETAARSSNGEGHLSNQELPDYDLSFFNDSVEMEIVSDIDLPNDLPVTGNDSNAKKEDQTAMNFSIIENLHRALMEIASTSQTSTNEGGERASGSDKEVDHPLQKQISCENTKKSISHRRKSCAQEEVDLPTKRVPKMTQESEQLNKRTGPPKIQHRRKTMSEEWMISEAEAHDRKSSNKPSSEARDKVAVYDRRGELAFVSSVAKTLSSDQGEQGKVAPVKIIRRRNTVGVQNCEDAAQKKPESSREMVRKHRKSSADAPKSSSTNPKDSARRPSSSKRSPSAEIKQLKEPVVNLTKFPKSVGENVMIPLKEYVPPSHPKSSKKAQPRNAKFRQLFGPDSDDEPSDVSSKPSTSMDPVPWKPKRLDDYMLKRSIKHGSVSSWDVVFQTAVEFKVEGVKKELGKSVEVEQELETSIVSPMAEYSHTEIAKQDYSWEIQSINEINNLMQMCCPSNVEISPEQLVCVPDMPHQEQFEQPQEVLREEVLQPPAESAIRGRAWRGRGRGRGRGSRNITPLRIPPNSVVFPPLANRAQSEPQAPNCQAITHVEFCEALWQRIFYNVKNCEMLIKQKNSYLKLQAMEQQTDLALKRHHQARQKEVEELAGLTLEFLRKRAITNFVYKEFLRSCYNYGGRVGMRTTVPALVKFLFSVVGKIKEIEPHLQGFVQRFCSDVEVEYEKSVRSYNARDDFILPTFPPSPPPSHPHVGTNSKDEVTTTSASPTAAIPSSTASPPAPVIAATPDLIPAAPSQDAVVPVREIKSDSPTGFTPMQSDLLNVQILQYWELHKKQQQLLSKSTQQHQWYLREPSPYYPPLGGYPIAENFQPTIPLNHIAEFYQSQALQSNPMINDNFRIRLPLAVPHNRDQVTPPTTPEYTPTQTAPPPADYPPATNPSSDLEEKDVKREVEAIAVTFEEDEVIDVDRWFIEKMKQSDFIDLDDYEMPDTDPDENDVKVEDLIVHPTLLEVERICICSKKATLLCLCGLAIYCSAKCQTDDWCNHEKICASTRKRKFENIACH